MKKSGFTLLELLVVVAIIAVLVSMMIPSLQKARQAADDMMDKSRLHAIGVGLHTYYSEYNRLPPIYDSNNWGRVCGNHEYMGLGLLYKTKCIADIVTLFCTQDEYYLKGKDAYTKRFDTWKDQNWGFCGYYYRNFMGGSEYAKAGEIRMEEETRNSLVVCPGYWWFEGGGMHKNGTISHVLMKQGDVRELMVPTPMIAYYDWRDLDYEFGMPLMWY